MQVQLAGVSRHHGARTILDQVTLAIGPHARVGVVGPNGVGKSTLLRLVAGLEQPDDGTVSRAPETLSVGYLAQERDLETSASILGELGIRTGVAAAEAELHRAAAALARDASVEEQYTLALERFLSLGGGDFEPRAHTICAELGLAIDLRRRVTGLSGGEAARVALAAILLSRYDVLLLDEPTNDLDYDGLEKLERFLSSYQGALVLVSHDRELLDRTVSRILEIDPSSHRAREWSGTWSEYAAARETERRSAYARYEQATERRRRLTELLSTRRTEARSRGAGLGEKTGGADRRGTNALRTKVRQAERLLERNELPEKPFEPWELRLTLDAGARPSDTVVALEDAVIERDRFRLGPLTLDLVPGERLAVTGRNGAGKSTLLAALLGELPLQAGRRVVGRRTEAGSVGQQRTAYVGEETLLEACTRRTGLAPGEARTLLAKFGLGVEHVARPCRSLSPGERTRAHLAELQARKVNLLVLDEPTNHLDIEAIEELESALAGYRGTVVVVSHDRRFLETIAPTRELAL